MAPDVDQVRQPHRADVAGTVGIFNAVVVGVAGLYAGTGSVLLTAATGAIAAVLAGVNLVTFRSAADPTTPAPLEPAPHIGSAAADEGSSMQQRDEEESSKAFEDFFRIEYPGLVHRVMRLGASLAEADDIAAEAMVRTLVRWTDVDNPAAYAYTCARHAYFAAAKQRQHEAPLDDEHQEDGDRTVLSAQDELDLGEQQRQVLAILGSLPRMQRTVMALFYAGLSVAEIARELEMPEVTVRSNQRHARNRLRALLTDDHQL